MTSQEIKDIVSSGEGYNAEFKVRIPQKVKELTEEVCALANSAGGVVLIGVDDHNTIKGITIDNAKRSAIQNSLGEITPALYCKLEIVNIDGLNVAVLEIPSGKNKPYVLSGAIYVRVGPNTQKLTTAAEMRDFFQQTDKLYFDETVCTTFDVSTQIDPLNFKVFRTEANIHASITDQQILQNLQLFVDDGHFKSGAVLFFGEHPETFYEQAIIRCIRFDGNDKRFISDDKKYGGPVFQQYLQAKDWLRGKLNIAYDIEGQGGGARKENWEIPETVFREAIINSLSHRDYYEKGAVTTIEVFDDRVEITNPGGLLAAIGKEFGRKSLSRNPLVFGLFERMHLVEKVGSGITRMKELMVGNGLQAPEYRMEGMFTIILKRPLAFAPKTIDSVTLSENQLHILKLIRENESITSLKLSKAIGISERAVQNNIKKLRQSGVIERIGSRKEGKWKVLMEFL